MDANESLIAIGVIVVDTKVIDTIDPMKAGLIPKLKINRSTGHSR